MKINIKIDGKLQGLLICFDIFLSAIIIIFFLGYLNLHAEIIGLKRSPIQIPEQVAEFWNVFGWIVFGGLAIDIWIKYHKVGQPKIFIRRYWLDILMLVLWPVFAGLKFAKISVKVVKGLKLIKSGYKAVKAAKNSLGRKNAKS